jgi:exonuclease III
MKIQDVKPVIIDGDYETARTELDASDNETKLTANPSNTGIGQVLSIKRKRSLESMVCVPR